MKKTAAIFLILALVMSFFVACDDSGSGSAEGFFPVVRKVPTTEEKTKVREMSGETINYAVIAMAAVEEMIGNTNEEKINSLFAYYEIQLICDGNNQTVEIDDVNKKINIAVSFKSPSGDNHLKVEGLVSGIGENVFSFSFNLTVKIGTSTSLNASGSVVFDFTDSAPLINISKAEYNTVTLNNIDYVASEFDYGN